MKGIWTLKLPQISSPVVFVSSWRTVPRDTCDSWLFGHRSKKSLQHLLWLNLHFRRAWHVVPVPFSPRIQTRNYQSTFSRSDRIGWRLADGKRSPPGLRLSLENRQESRKTDKFACLLSIDISLEIVSGQIFT
jgi:hypothetical protein